MKKDKLYPYYYQQNEDAETEFLGYFHSWDEAASVVDSNYIGEMTVIDVADDDMMDEFYKYNELKDDDLKRYLAEKGAK